MHSDSNSGVVTYIDEIREQIQGNQAREHGYRPALERLMRSFNDVGATNDPKRSEHGNPDMIFYKKSNHDVILGYAEAKDITVDLDKIVRTEQLHRYAGYNKLFLTNYLDFRFYRNGEEYERVSIGKLRGQNEIEFDRSQFGRLADQLQAFLDLPPEPIKSGKNLALIMGQKARRIRDSAAFFLSQDNEKNQELEKIYEMMKKLLVHDLTKEKFADMYAQTLVYGLFAARYSDKTPDDFTRQEASELVPASNPFLREFFAHIGGIHFDKRLAVVVDELCEVFAVSNISLLVQKHLRLFEVENEKDPIIHFYEDFLKEYDPAERKRMGAYYTPIPVVRFIIRQVDEILKKDFGLSKGLADTSKIVKEIDTGQDLRHDRRYKLTTTQKYEFHKVQVLDPAVGTATFLNETIKFIAKGFEGQGGRWPAYAKTDLLPRLSGFELMMAPYTIAHLKLAMTLQETGVTDLHNQRLGVYLTNTLEEGIPNQQDLFTSLGLAAAITEESQKASEIKHDRPIMVIMGNPPYSVSSNNKSDFAQELVKPYKKNLNERKINLDDDYIKFIAFAEKMIAKNDEGIVAMITNNSYIDGITHRQMRKHLLETFDKIHILDLHGNSKKKETAPDGSKDENVFNIMQGVSIVLMIKTGGEQTKLADIYHAELWGKRNSKFEKLKLSTDAVKFTQVGATEPYFFFTPKNGAGVADYDNGISVNELFFNKSSGFRSGADSAQICWAKEQITTVVNDLIEMPEQNYRNKYNLKDGRNHNYTGMKKDVGSVVENDRIVQTLYRPFDIRWTYYSKKSSGFVAWPRNQTMQHFVGHKNIGLVYKRGYIEERAAPAGITDLVSGERTWSRPGMQGADTVAPLWLYHDDGTRTPNFAPDQLKRLTVNLVVEPSPEDILDYIYAVLYSPTYREKYKEFLKIDFPRVPAPTSDTEFTRLTGFGKRLRELHLMKSLSLEVYATTFPETGTNEVEKVSYVDGKVYINDNQYFGNVPEMAWDFYIGGYQPAQKYLKDRKTRQLTNEEIDHYQKILKALEETQKLMEQIDGE